MEQLSKALFLVLLTGVVLAACSTTTYVPVHAAQAPATTAPTPAPVVPAAAFSQTGTVSPIGSAFTLPAAGGYAPVLTFGAGSLPSGIHAAATVTNTAPAGIGTLDKRRLAAESFAANALLYVGLNFSQSTTANGALTLQTSIPAGAVPAGDVLWLALYDPTAATLVWQYGIAGPAQVSGGAATFTIPGGYPFTAGAPYWFSIYALPAGFATPAPAAASLTVSPATLTLGGTGAANAKTIAIVEPGYKGYFAISSGDTTVAGVSAPIVLGPAGTVTVTPAGGGATTLTISDQNGQIATVAVGVTTGTVNVAGVITHE